MLKDWCWPAACSVESTIRVAATDRFFEERADYLRESVRATRRLSRLALAGCPHSHACSNVRRWQWEPGRPAGRPPSPLRASREGPSAPTPGSRPKACLAVGSVNKHDVSAGLTRPLGRRRVHPRWPYAIARHAGLRTGHCSRSAASASALRSRRRSAVSTRGS